MANIKRHLINVHSELDVNEKKWNDENVVQEAKAPKADDLLYGELAVNNGKGFETLFTKNSNDEVIAFPNNQDIEYLAELIDELSGKTITVTSEDGTVEITTISANTVDLSIGDALSGITEYIDNNISAITEDIDEIYDELEYTLSSITSTDKSVKVKQIDNHTIDLAVQPSYISSAYTLVEYQTPFSSATVEIGDSYEDAINTVEEAVSDLVDEVIKDEKVTTAAINALGKAAGTIDAKDVIAYVPSLDKKYISGATKLSEADEMLNDAIINLEGGVDGKLSNVVSSITSVDSSVTISNTDSHTVDLSVVIPDSPTIDIAQQGKLISISGSGTLNHTLEIDDEPLQEALLILTSAITDVNESAGFNENAEYIPQAPSISGFTKLSTAVDYLATQIEDLTSRIKKIEESLKP